MSAHQELYLKPRECEHRIAIDHVTMTWKSLISRSPAQLFMLLYCRRRKVGWGLESKQVNTCVHVEALLPISPLPQPLLCTHTHTHTQSKVTALCNEKSDWLQYNVESPLKKILEQKRDFEERIQPYMAKLAPPPGQWLSFCYCLPYQFMSAASVCSIPLETSQKSLQEQSWFLSNFFCWCMLFTKPLNHGTKLHTS